MPKPDYIELESGEQIPILYEDRSIIAIDKPYGWMLAPDSWRQTGRNLQTALTSSIAARDFWVRARNLKFLRFVHRLDAETTGIVLLAKSPGAVPAYSRLFESRQVQKVYLAVVHGRPKESEWTCRLKLAPDEEVRGKMKVDPKLGKDAETEFRVVQAGVKTSLIEAQPLTGRTHQIRVHLARSGYPAIGDQLYGRHETDAVAKLALRAVALTYVDPFTKRLAQISAPADQFLHQYGFDRIQPAPERSHR